MGAPVAGTVVASTLMTVGKYLFNQAVTWAGKAVDVYGPQKGVGVVQSIVTNAIGDGIIQRGLGTVAGYFIAGETKDLLTRDKVDLGTGMTTALVTQWLNRDTKEPVKEETKLLSKEPNHPTNKLMKLARQHINK